MYIPVSPLSHRVTETCFALFAGTRTLKQRRPITTQANQAATPDTAPRQRPSAINRHSRRCMQTDPPSSKHGTNHRIIVFVALMLLVCARALSAPSTTEINPIATRISEHISQHSNIIHLPHCASFDDFPRARTALRLFVCVCVFGFCVCVCRSSLQAFLCVYSCCVCVCMFCIFISGFLTIQYVLQVKKITSVVGCATRASK